MKVIVTGSEGFIGRALAAHLRDNGAEVIGIDRKNGVEVMEYFDTARRLRRFDAVFHLAAQTSVFNNDREQIEHDNIRSFMSVCDACRYVGVKLVYASSSTANDGNFTSLYGISKRFDEEYARCYNPHATGIRFHNVYGPSPRQGTLLWYLLNQDSVKLYNNGENVRHFTYIEDIVRSIIYCRTSDRELVNAANPELTLTLKLAQIVSKYKYLDIELVSEKRDFDRVEQSVNNSIFTVPLPYTSVGEGIRKIFEYETAR